MTSPLSFLGAAHAQLLNDVLRRRNPQLLDRVQRASRMSQTDSEQIVYALSEEFVNDLDDQGEPTEYGRVVSSLLAEFNRARISEWP